MMKEYSDKTCALEVEDAENKHQHPSSEQNIDKPSSGAAIRDKRRPWLVAVCALIVFKLLLVLAVVGYYHQLPEFRTSMQQSGFARPPGNTVHGLASQGDDADIQTTVVTMATLQGHVDIAVGETGFSSSAREHNDNQQFFVDDSSISAPTPPARRQTSHDEDPLSENVGEGSEDRAMRDLLLALDV